MDPRKQSFVSRQPGRPSAAPSRETMFFSGLKGVTVTLETLAGGVLSGRLAWAGRYSLIVEQNGVEVLYWKHGLKSIRIANGRGDE